MDRSAQQLLAGTFAHLVVIGAVIATLGAVFGASRLSLDHAPPSC